MKNQAFILIKPHAVNSSVKEVVEKALERVRSLTISAQGSISSQGIDAKNTYYYMVDWEAADLAWVDFRGQVLGPTDPKEAPAGSIRGLLLREWEALGLMAMPNIGHAQCVSRYCMVLTTE